MAVQIDIVVVSADLKHDNAFVQHVHDTIITPWIKEHVVDPDTFSTEIHFSDGGPAHFKLSDHIFWISTHQEKHGIEIKWNFMGPGHGKKWSDGSGGACKNAGQLHQLRSALGETQKLCDSTDFFNFLRDKMAVPSQTIEQKKGRGLLKRFFFHVPVTGGDAVNRRIPKCETFDGIKKVYFSVDDIGQRGMVKVRAGSCFSCSQCQEETIICAETRNMLGKQ